MPPVAQQFPNVRGNVRQAGQRLVDVLQAARSSFSDELSRNFPRSQGGRGSNSRQRARNDQPPRISVICLPPGTATVPSHTQLLSLTNSGSGYGYPLGSDSSGSIPCPTNFNSESEFLLYVRRYFGALSGNNTPCSFYKRTQGLGLRLITFSSYQELRDAVGRGALVIVPNPTPSPGNNGYANPPIPDASQPRSQQHLSSLPGFNTYLPTGFIPSVSGPFAPGVLPSGDGSLSSLYGSLVPPNSYQQQDGNTLSIDSFPTPLYGSSTSVPTGLGVDTSAYGFSVENRSENVMTNFPSANPLTGNSTTMATLAVPPPLHRQRQKEQQL